MSLPHRLGGAGRDTPPEPLAHPCFSSVGKAFKPHAGSLDSSFGCASRSLGVLFV